MKYNYMCPYCWQITDTLIDISVSEQFYVEDCQICCHPIEIHYKLSRLISDELLEEMTDHLAEEDIMVTCFEVRQENGGEWS